MAPQYINVPLEYRWLTIHLRKKESTIHFDISDFVLTNSCGQYLQKGIHEQILYIGNHTHMTSMKFVQIFNFHSSIFKLPTPPPPPPSHSKWWSWSLTIYFIVALHSCVCNCPKISRNVFLKKVLLCSFCNQPVFFA